MNTGTINFDTKAGFELFFIKKAIKKIKKIWRTFMEDFFAVDIVEKL